MDLDFHIPVSDLRLLATQPIGRRRRPLWPFGNVTADPGSSEFLPGFGPLRRTPVSATGSWEGRAQYVPADRAIRFPDSLAAYLRAQLPTYGWDVSASNAVQVACLHRRYFGSATSVRSFLEVSLEVTEAAPFTWRQLGLIVDVLLEMKVRVAGGKPRPLMRISSDLATYVRTNTTVGHFDGHAPSWLVVGGDVQCVVSLAQAPAGPVPDWLTALDEGDGRGMYYARHQDCDVWFVVETDAIRRKTARLYLSRLHSERAAFTAILNGLVRSDGDPRAVFSAQSDRVRDALRDCLEYLDKKHSHGHLQPPLLQTLAWDLDVHGDQWDALERHISRLPDTTQTRLTRFVANYDLRGAQGVQIGSENRMDSRFDGNPGGNVDASLDEVVDGK